MPENRVLHIVRTQPASSPNVRRYSVESRTWVEPIVGPAGDCGPSCYLDGKVYVTTSQRNFFAILPNGTIQPRAGLPVVMDRSYTVTHAILCPLGNYLFAFCGNGDIWRYDRASDSWGSGRYGSIPWRWPHHKFEPEKSGWNYLSATCIGPVPPHDVAMVCSPSVWSMNGTVPARAFLWKP
jgi:hypothetical protein